MKVELSGQRILIALHRFTVGGAETQALYLAKELRKNGYEVIIGAFGTEEGEGIARFERERFTCVRWGFQEKLILYPAKGIFGFLRKQRYTRKLIDKVLQMGIEMIIPFTYPANRVFCHLYKRKKNIEVFWNQRDEGRGFFGSEIEIEALNSATHIISNSLEGIQFLKQFTNKPIHLISNAVDINLFVRGGNDKSKNVLMIGNLHGYKDHFTLIHSWKIVNKRFPDYKLLLAGKAGDTFAACEKLVDDFHLQDSVQFLGLINDIPRLLEDCQLAVFSSNNEGVPNGVLEPMAAGLAVVATDILGTREALGDNYPFLIKSDNSKQFAACIIQLLSNSELRMQVGDLNRKRVEEFFSITVMADQYLKLVNV